MILEKHDIRNNIVMQYVAFGLILAYFFIYGDFIYNYIIGNVYAKISKLLLIVIFSFFFIVYFHSPKLKIRNKQIYIIFFLQCMYFLIISLYFCEYPIFKLGLFFLINAIFFVLIENYLDIRRLCKLLVFTAAILSFSAFFSFILGVLGIISYSNIYPDLRKPGEDYYLYLFSFTVKPIVLGSRVFFKAYSIFIEPGEFGLFLLYSLVINSIVVKNRLAKYIILFCGFVSFSMAYYILALTYLFIEMKKKDIKIIVILFIAVVGLFHLGGISNFFSSRIINRVAYHISYIENTGRYKSFADSLPLFIESPILGNGLAIKKKLIENEERIFASVMGDLASYGIIGVFILYCFYFYVIFFFVSHKKIKQACLVLLLLLNQFVDPNFNRTFYQFTIFVILLYSIKYKSKKNDVKIPKNVENTWEKNFKTYSTV